MRFGQEGGADGEWPARDKGQGEGRGMRRIDRLCTLRSEGGEKGRVGQYWEEESRGGWEMDGLVWDR